MSKYSDIAPDSTIKLQEHLGSLYDYIKEGDIVLDFGSSTGYFGKLLIDNKNCVVDGIEIDPGDLKEASKVLRKMYCFDLDTSWPAEIYKKKYDVLFMGDIIEHLKYPDATLSQAMRLLKPGGRILISTPNVAHISNRLELLSGEFNYESTGLLDNTHLKYFTIRSLNKLASDTGYKIVNVDYSLVDFSPAVIKRLLKKIGLSPSDKFWSLVNSPEARAYQYKLVLVPAIKGEKIKPAEAPPKPITEHDVLGEELIALRKENSELKAHIHGLSTELNKIINSKTWRAAKALKSPYVVIRSKVRK